MTLLELFRDLTYGELSQLALGNLIPDESESEPDAKSYAHLISHINLGLTELHKRYLLSAKEIYVEQYDHILTYQLHSDFAATNTESAEVYKYILDTAENPFRDDILKIEMVFNEIGEELFLNKRVEEDSLFTPTHTSIQLPSALFCNTLAVQYRANHPKLDFTYGMDPSEIEILLPDSLKLALLYFIANRAFGVQNTDQGQHASVYFKKYEEACMKFELFGLDIQPEAENQNFDERGWI